METPIIRRGVPAEAPPPPPPHPIPEKPDHADRAHDPRQTTGRAFGSGN